MGSNITASTSLFETWVRKHFTENLARLNTMFLHISISKFKSTFPEKPYRKPNRINKKTRSKSNYHTWIGTHSQVLFFSKQVWRMQIWVIILLPPAWMICFLKLQWTIHSCSSKSKQKLDPYSQSSLRLGCKPVTQYSLKVV